MPKNKENRGQGGQKADRQDRAAWKNAKNHGPGNPNEYRQPVQQPFQQPIQPKPGNLAYYKKLLQARRQQNQDRGLAQGTQARKGCLPKLFMLALPFAFVLTCLIPGL